MRRRPAKPWSPPWSATWPLLTSRFGNSTITLEISRRTLETREAVARADADAADAAASRRCSTCARQNNWCIRPPKTIPGIQQQIEQTENRISLLLGQNPGDVLRGRSLTDQDLPPEVPAGLPSALLERRPDIRAAEQDLIAANAQIGVARAAYFPTLSLSGALGGASTQLSSLFSASNSTWSLVPQVTQPIFTGGRIKSGVESGRGRSANAR